MRDEDFQQLQQLEQLSIAFQLALKGTTPQVRAALNLQGFTKTRRVATQKLLFIMVGCIRQVRRKP